LKDRIRFLEEDIRTLKPYTRKRVRKLANDKFTSIKGIATAQEALRKAPQRRGKIPREGLGPDLEKV